MTKLRITSALLDRFAACPQQVELFRKTFPRGAAITVNNVVLAYAVGLDVHWLARQLARHGVGDYRNYVVKVVQQRAELQGFVSADLLAQQHSARCLAFVAAGAA